jgi:hypothetical protein
MRKNLISENVIKYLKKIKRFKTFVYTTTNQKKADDFGRPP